MRDRKDIENRDDIYALVVHFYANVRADDMLGPIFSRHISDDQWPAHLEKLTDFWETTLFGVRKFKGSPSQKHIGVDRSMEYGVEQAHFGRWLQLWFSSIREMYSGKLATEAEEAARRMAHGQYLSIWMHRPVNQKMSD